MSHSFHPDFYANAKAMEVHDMLKWKFNDIKQAHHANEAWCEYRRRTLPKRRTEALYESDGLLILIRMRDQ
jgi:hypothetical protein